MSSHPPYMKRSEELGLMGNPEVFHQILIACRPLRDHYMQLCASGCKDGVVGFLYVDWHWATSPRTGRPEEHREAVSLLVQNLPERTIRDEERKWSTDMRPFLLPSFVDVWLGDGYKRILLHHRKIGL